MNSAILTTNSNKDLQLLLELAKKLKQKCGTGETIKNSVIEIPIAPVTDMVQRLSDDG